MVSPEEYFYYLRKAFKNNHIHGYMIDCKANRKTCIYSENGKWVVSEIQRGVAVSPREYDLDDLWHACEDIIARLSRDEEHRKKTWMDWASPTNWAEKMDEPIAIRKLSPEEARKIVKAKSQGYSHVKESKGTYGADILAENDKGIDDMESGRVTPHEESMKLIRQRYVDYVKKGDDNKAIDHDEWYRIIKKYIVEYDFYSLLEHGAPDDEFDSYSRELADRITPEDSVESIADSIAVIFDKAFAEGVIIENYMDFARKIRMALRNEG